MMSIKLDLNQISKMLLHLPELRDPQPEEKDDDGDTNNETGPIEGNITAKNAPSETVYNANQGVQAVKEPPIFRDYAAAEANRGNVQAELNEKRNHIAKIPVLHVERSDPQPGTQTGQQGQEDEDRQQQYVPVRGESIVGHESQQNYETDEEIHEGSHHRGGGNDQPWKVDFADQVGVAYQAVGRFSQRGGKKGPRKQGRKDHEGIRRVPVAGQPCHPAKDHRENHHGQKRPEDRPGNPDNRLLVAYGDVAPGQNKEELPVAPEVHPVVFLGAAGLDNENRLLHSDERWFRAHRCRT